MCVREREREGGGGGLIKLWDSGHSYMHATDYKYDNLILMLILAFKCCYSACISWEEPGDKATSMVVCINLHTFLGHSSSSVESSLLKLAIS